MVYSKFRGLLSFVFFGYIFLYLPIVILIVFSFNDSELISSFTGFSFKWYAELFSDPDVLKALWVSLRVAFSSATLSIILGTITAVILVRMGKAQSKRILSIFATSALVLPEIIMGLSLFLLFIALTQTIGWPTQRGLLTLTIAHTTLAFAYVVVIVRSKLLDFDYNLEESALDLGAKPFKVFFHITLPILAPSLIAGWFLAFTLSLNNLILSIFLSGPETSTLPMYIFSNIRFGMSPKINALATLMILFVTLGVVLVGWILYSRQKKG